MFIWYFVLDEKMSIYNRQSAYNNMTRMCDEVETIYRLYFPLGQRQP